jgi:hypothetical protein
VSIADITAQRRMVIARVSRNLLRPMMCRLKRFTPLFTRICRFQEVGQLSDQTALWGDEEGAIQTVPGDHNDDHHSFLTISDNVLNVGGSAGGKKQASWHQPQSGGLLLELEGVLKMGRRQTVLKRSGSS